MRASKPILFATAALVAVVLAGCTDDFPANTDKGGDVDRYLREFSGKPETYTLTTGVSPTGGGYVSRSSDQASYAAGTDITVNAAANGGYAFAGWIGAPQGVDASSPSITFTINGNITLTANFQKFDVPSGTHSLTVSASSGGTVNPSGTSFPTSGLSISVTATANNGYRFTGWTGAPQGVDASSPSITFTINGNITLTANFQQQIDGTQAQGANLAAKLAWLDRMVTSQNTYTVLVTADETIDPYTFYYNGTIDVTIILMGSGANRTLKLKGHGEMFTVRSEVTFVLGNNITLQGHNGNTGTMVYVDGGTFKMNDGATITGNTTSGDGGGVRNGGIFEMNGGTISGNTASNRGGGVYVYGGTFTMNGGAIFGNKAKRGGGVYCGGWRSIFIMRGGDITRNTALEYGGGVYVDNSFNKLEIGGKITGYLDDSTNGNIVSDDDGVINRRGHAVYGGSDSRRRDYTVRPDEKLRFGVSGYDDVGDWDL